MAHPEKQEKWLKSIALVALIFAAMMSVLVIIHYLQLNRIDPVNTDVINTLVERLQENPADDPLREQIRELDLLARKAYFTNRWQVRSGGYLILLSLGIFVIIYQLLVIGKRQTVVADPDSPRDVLGINKSARMGISIVGILLVAIALILSFGTQKKRSDTLSEKGMVQVTDSLSVNTQAEADSGEQTAVDPLDTDSIPSGLMDASGISTATDEGKDPGLDPIPSEENKKLTADDQPEKSKAFPDAKELRRNSPAFRGHNGIGKIYQENVPVSWNGLTGDAVLWKITLPLQAYNSPIVWEDKIFLTGADESTREVYCFSKKDGKLLWSRKLAGISGSPAVPPKTTKDTGLGASTMTTDGTRVFAIFGTGDLIALDMQGNVIWAKNLGVPQNHYGHSSSLIMHQQKLIVQYDQKSNGRLMAFDALTGNLLWSTPRKEKISWASPILVYHNNKSQLIVVADPTVAGYDPWTGKQLWSLECISGEVGPSAAYDDGIVYAVNDYANIAAIDLNDPSKLLWENSEFLSDIPSPVAGNGLLIMPTSYGALACYDGKTGDILWEHEFDENIFSSPLIVGSLVYLMDTGGNMHIFRLTGDGYQAIAKNPLGEEAVCTPAFADGRIYIRTNKHLYCIGK